MKSRLFVVDDVTYATTVSTNIVSVKIPALTGDQWVKTIFDIMADMLQVEIGDYIFLWKQRASSQGSCIYGVYRAISKPYYDCSTPSDAYPFKIHIELAYDFTNPVLEYEVLNNPYNKNPLWNIIGKKVAGKSRGTSPLTIDESRYLISLLLDKNPIYKFYPEDKTHTITVPNPLIVDYTLTSNNTRPTTISVFDPNKLSAFYTNRAIRYEKILETIFNMELSNRNKTFFSQIGIDVDKVSWYSNYLPYSIEGKEMDYVIIESEDNLAPCTTSVVEFSINTIDEDHINKAFLYSRWISQTLALGTAAIQPILIVKSSVDFIKGETAPTKLRKLNALSTLITSYEKDYPLKRLKIYTYNFSSGSPKFTQVR